MSAMVTGIFWYLYDPFTNDWSASKCAPKCDIMHPRFFLVDEVDTWVSSSINERHDFEAGGKATRIPIIGEGCCGLQSFGAPCGLNEGPCKLNSDCEAGLVCGSNNCFWDER